MRAFSVRLPSGCRYWTVLDETFRPHPEVDEFLLHVRLGRDGVESTTQSHAISLALFLRWWRFGRQRLAGSRPISRGRSSIGCSTTAGTQPVLPRPRFVVRGGSTRSWPRCAASSGTPWYVVSYPRMRSPFSTSRWRCCDRKLSSNRWRDSTVSVQAPAFRARPGHRQRLRRRGRSPAWGGPSCPGPVHRHSDVADGSAPR